ncbi:TonB-dependent receptor [Desertivirga xinjiangensis]|uniref:TonB-dependent receptor n=1 Tax=Desertivirga xinjiangensis TaxID=539206 RepID=UPI00210B4022|nr:TonB-dependent receptor plug domain-containing protein [Pedobacter xinjiangensis]
MIKFISAFFSLIFFSIITNAQQAVTLEGYIFEEGKDIPVVGASLSTLNSHTKTDDSGYYALTLPAGSYKIVITDVRHDTLLVHLDIPTNTKRDFGLKLRSSTLQEVRVNSVAKNDLTKSISPNVQVLSKQDLEKVPGFLGQADPIKALQTLPGTGKGGEGNSGMYVRGGTSGQNLTLFNDAVIYNPSHLMGFFSVFNSAAVDEVKLYKSGIPSEFGGRLSSIIEVSSSKRIVDSLKVEGDVSLIAATTHLAIPVSKNWSISASARKTFMNASIWPALEKLNLGSSIFKKLRYDFYDLNFNSNSRLSKKNFLFLSVYYGGDDFGFGLGRFNISNNMNWNNLATSGSWKRIISDKVILNTTASYSQYNFDFGMAQDKYQAAVASQIKDKNLKSFLNVYLKNNTLKAGIQYIHHNFKPNTPFVNSSGVEYDFGTPNTYYSDESSIFLSDEITFSSKLSGYVGARMTMYRHKGPYTLASEDDTKVNYAKNKIVSTYTYVEPSLTLRYTLNSSSSVKLAYSSNTQPVHLVSVTAVNFPADFWMPSLKGISPEKGHQASVGYFKNFKQNTYESYVDLYYKKMDGLTEFSGGIMNLLDNLKIEDHLVVGSGAAYGLELYLKKKTGRITGWMGYTISKSDRTFALLNNGATFPAKYDRRHDVSFLAAYHLNPKWSLSFSFTYATGNAYTKPVGRYLLSGNIVNEYGSYNGARIPAYHRADVAATHKLKSTARTESSLSFSVYNLYNRQNPAYVFFLAEGDLTKYSVSVQPKSVAILPFLPSVTYKFSFR